LILVYVRHSLTSFAAATSATPVTLINLDALKAEMAKRMAQAEAAAKGPGN